MLALRRYAFDQYGRVASLGLKRRAPTLEPALPKRNVFRPWCPVFALAWLAAPVPFLECSFAGPGPVCFLFLFLLLAAGVTFQLLEGGTSGQTQGHRPKNRFWAPTQGPALSGIPLDVRCSVTLVPCIRSIKSAGHMVVCVATGQMVGDRGFPGATTLGVESIYLLSQPSLSCPADRSRTS